MGLTATKDDNGYVTMFFLLIPVLSALISFLLSWWIPGLQFVPSPMFFVGMALVTISLFLLSLTSWRASQPRGAAFGATIQEDGVEPASVGARDRPFPAIAFQSSAGPLDQKPAQRAAKRSFRAP